MKFATVSVLSLVAALGLGSSIGHAEDVDPPEVSLGHRLFQETRFAQYFMSHASSDINRDPLSGKEDFTLYFTRTATGNLPGAYRGKSMNCASCHLVDEHKDTPGGGMRAYTDFARRSPLPTREDGRNTTVRNPPTMVNASIERDTPLFMHYDGQFTSTQELVETGLTGRNFGWLPNEADQAIRQIARVIRGDDGTDDLARQYFGSYAQVFEGADPGIPEEFRIPSEYRLKIAKASDEQIFHAVSRMIAVYTDSLRYSQDEQGNYNGSPYDLFLAKNKLPQKPAQGESPLKYAERLLKKVQGLTQPVFVTEADGHYEFQDPAHRFQFGKTELQGLKTFLSRSAGPNAPGGGVGNCVACHAPPHFTDFKFHNTGATQDEFDSLHGRGAFADLAIPGLRERNADPERYLMPSPRYPLAQSIFYAVPSSADPMKADLGLWNIYANPDVPNSQKSLRALFCKAPQKSCDDEKILNQTIATFKTPSLRDLGQSAPYLHTGQMNTVKDVLRFYMRSSVLSRAEKLRNGDTELRGISMTARDFEPLAAFLDSLNEDYH